MLITACQAVPLTTLAVAPPPRVFARLRVCAFLRREPSKRLLTGSKDLRHRRTERLLLNIPGLICAKSAQLPEKRSSPL